MQYYCLAFVPTPREGYAIFSPDFMEITSQGETISECVEMATDALRITIEEYAKMRKPLPTPSTIEEAKRKIKAEIQELGIEVPLDDILYQFIPAPSADITPVRISATFTKHTLDIIDTKAKTHGMSRSRFLAVAAKAYA